MTELPGCFGAAFSVREQDCVRDCLVRDRCVSKMATQLMPQTARELGFQDPAVVPITRWQEALELEVQTVEVLLRVGRGVPVKVALEPKPPDPSAVSPATEPAKPLRKKRPPPNVSEAQPTVRAPQKTAHTLAPVEKGPAWERAFARERARSDWVRGLPDGWRGERELDGVRYGACLDLHACRWVDHEGREYPTLYRLTMEVTGGGRKFSGEKSGRPDRVMSNWSTRKFWGRRKKS